MTLSVTKKKSFTPWTPRMWGLLLLVCGAGPVLDLLAVADWLELPLAVPNVVEEESC